MQHWDNLKAVPANALKKIEGGRLNGMSDIKPQWRYEAMTKEFGVCGIGWKYEIVNTHTQDTGNGEIMVFVQISLYIKDGDKWSDPIPGFGGDFLVEKERKGLHVNDEAYKMATTDALGVAMKMLGVAADVYMGLANDSKYGRDHSNGNKGQSQQQSSKNSQPSEFEQAQKKVAEKRQAERHESNSKSDLRWGAFWASAKKLGFDETAVYDIGCKHFDKPFNSLKEVIATQQELNKFLTVVAKHKKSA